MPYFAAISARFLSVSGVVVLYLATSSGLYFNLFVDWQQQLLTAHNAIQNTTANKITTIVIQNQASS